MHVCGLPYSKVMAVQGQSDPLRNTQDNKCLDTHNANLPPILMLRIHSDIALDSLQCYFNGPIHTWHIFCCKFAAIFLQCNFFALDPFLSCNFCSAE